MKNLKNKFLTFCVCGTLSLTLMSFNSAEDNLYGSSNMVQSSTNAVQDNIEEESVRAAVRLTVAATKYAVRYTKEVARVSLPNVMETIRTATTFAYQDLASHKSTYKSDLESYKDMKIRSLG